jgi:hypothetical protein
MTTTTTFSVFISPPQTYKHKPNNILHPDLKWLTEMQVDLDYRGNAGFPQFSNQFILPYVRSVLTIEFTGNLYFNRLID